MEISKATGEKWADLFLSAVAVVNRSIGASLMLASYSRGARALLRVD